MGTRADFGICSPPSGFEQKKKKHEKKMPLSEKKTQFQQKKALFDIISFLKRVFCLPFFTQNIPFQHV